MANKPQMPRLCAALIILAVLLTVTAISACRADRVAVTPGTSAPVTEEPVATTVLPTVTTDATTAKSITTAAITTEAPMEKGYWRADTSGTSVQATVARGPSGNMSLYTSVSGLTVLGDSLYASDETGKRVYKLSLGGTLQKIYISDRAVNSVVTDGTHLYALEGGLDGHVTKLSADLAVLGSIAVGHTPSDMAIVGNKGYVTNRFSGTVSVIDLTDMRLLSTLEIDGREPIAAVAVGKEIYVACHLPDESMENSVVSANVVVLSSESDSATGTIPLVNGASGVKDICASPDGKTVYVSHIIGRYAYPTTQLDRGWINTNGFSVLDTASKDVLCTCLLDEVDEGAANPWGITVSGDGKYLCVALSGLDEVMLVDITMVQNKIRKVLSGAGGRAVDTPADIVNFLPFLDGCRERVSVGKGVRAIVEQGGVLYCALYFDGAVGAVKLSDRSVKRLQFAKQPEATPVRQGQILWSDANNCYQKWQSCNSCHPDAVVDGFNWDNLNDGLGNGKSAKSMLYAHRTPPVMVTGIRANAEIAVAAGMKFIQFNTLDEEELSRIDLYLKSLAPLKSPALATDGTLTDSALSGEPLFETNCASCHPAPLYTDLKKHDVGTARLAGEDGNYDTPTLVEVWRTAPYMHDGSLGTIEEVVRYFAKDLSNTEVQQLADYVRSIGNEGEAYGVEQVVGYKRDGSRAYNVYADGMQLQTITVRCQKKDATKRVVVSLSVLDKNGKQVFYSDTVVSDLTSGDTAVLRLDAAVELPAGGSYTVAFYDADSGAAVASALRIK